MCRSVGNTKEQILKEAEEIPDFRSIWQSGGADWFRVGLQFGTGERGTDRATENIRRDPSVVYLSHFA